MGKLKERLDAGEFVVTSELNPPKGIDLGSLFEKADALKDHVHAFNLTDSHAARMSMAPIGAAHLLLDRGIEPIVQLTTRDRNRLALQSDMLAAHALGVRNLMVMGGDPPANGDHPEAKPVFDMFSSQLLSAAQSMTKGQDMSGQSLSGAPDFLLGAVANPGATDLDEEMGRLEEKVQAGAQFIQTQAVYDPDMFEQFMRRVEPLRISVLAGVIPVKSRKMADYMNNNVPGISIPQDIIEAIENAPDKAQKSVALSAELIERLRPMCQGVHIMAIGWEDKIPHMLRPR